MIYLEKTKTLNFIFLICKVFAFYYFSKDELASGGF